LITLNLIVIMNKQKYPSNVDRINQGIY